MIIKATFVILDCIAIFIIGFITRLISKNKEHYARDLRNAMLSALFAIVGNIFIALAWNSTVAQFSFILYFISIDWILYWLSGFCLLYTEHYVATRRLKWPTLIVYALDSLSIFLNVFFAHHFTVYEITGSDGTVFYQTAFNTFYYFHLAVDYAAIITAFVFLVYKIVKTYSFYRTKYAIIFFVLVLIIILNVVYMAFSLVLDASVLFYAIAGMLIFLSIRIFVPRSLMNSTIGKAVDDMSEGLILFDISNNCIFANEFSLHRFNIDLATFNFDCEPMKTIRKNLARKNERFGESDYVVTDSDGNVVCHYFTRLNELTDSKDRVIGSYLLIEDITNTMALMNELNEAKANAENANVAKSTFLANMSHEIRTPLNSVLGMNEMILRSTKDPALTEYAETIRSSGEILLSLINDILDFSKIEAGKMELFLEGYNPHKLLTECNDSFEQMAVGKGLYLTFKCDESIPSGLKGDEKRLRQILSNIISNAIKYTKKGGVTVEMWSESLDEKHLNLVISVSDTGIGISKTDQEYLFDSFRRVNEEENATIQGTGLGLSITKELITLMNGTIGVSSIEGEGSVFKITVPQEILSFSPVGPLRLIAEQKEYTYTETFRAPKAKLLVVDDVAVNLKVVQALLKKTLIEVDTAKSGLQAIDMCRQKKYDIILLDHRMPEPDGIETFKIISDDGFNTDTPVIILTANALSGAEEEYRAMGFSDYLSKPIRSNELELAILRHLPVEKVEIV